MIYFRNLSNDCLEILRFLSDVSSDFLRTSFGLPSDSERINTEEIADTDILYRSCDEFLDCGFSVRILNCLHQADLSTLLDVLQYGKKELLRIRNFGKTSLAEVEALFKKYGIEFD